ncbi:unnamed protein product [Lactuca virosa]|uniref:Uncharacterized protein n=1 Tax=Lactuca virosa TaxID=75947 RepID=A0AAU9ME37_9ASTR|nr:unnamed protein product [Lactuca virosa]
MNANNFHYTGSIQEVMLYKVLANNEIIDIYRKIPKPCERHISPSLQVVLHAGNVQRTSSVKRKSKVVDEDVPTKPKTQRKQKKKAKVTVVDEDDDENTMSDVRIEDVVANEDTMRSSNPL